MAISSPNNYRSNNSKVYIYYIAVALIIIAAAAFLFYSPGKKQKESENIQPVKPVETAPPVTAQPQTDSGGIGIVADANGRVGPRVMALLKDAQMSIDAGKIITARNTFNDILNMAMDDVTRERVKKQMNELAQDWLFSRNVQFGDDLCSSYKVQPGELLSQIAVKYKVPYQFLMRINNITSEKNLRADQVIKVVNGPFHAIVYSSTFTMDLYLQNIYVNSYKVGLGKPGHETPVGLWRAKLGGKMIKPTWTDPDTGKTYHAEDPDYPLGSGWIALEGVDSRTRGIEGIAIHGTNEESTIGTKSSRGCIRLYNGELTEVFDMFEPGCSELRVVE